MALAATDSARTRSARAFARAEKSLLRKHQTMNLFKIRLRLLRWQLESCAIVQPRLYDSAMQGTEPPIPIPVGIGGPGHRVGVPPPICRGSGVHPHHPHPRFAGDRGSLPWAVHHHHRPRRRLGFAGDRGSSPGGGSHRPGDSEVRGRTVTVAHCQWATVTASGSRWANHSLAHKDVQRYNTDLYRSAGSGPALRPHWSTLASGSMILDTVTPNLNFESEQTRTRKSPIRDRSTDSRFGRESIGNWEIPRFPIWRPGIGNRGPDWPQIGEGIPDSRFGR
jgi:hypothetical protein